MPWARQANADENNSQRWAANSQHQWRRSRRQRSVKLNTQCALIGSRQRLTYLQEACSDSVPVAACRGLAKTFFN
eukprot:353199-Chlamydomonas_euryale.AAC.2